METESGRRETVRGGWEGTESGPSAVTRRSRHWPGEQGIVSEVLAYKVLENVVLSGRQHCLSKNN